MARRGSIVAEAEAEAAVAMLPRPHGATLPDASRGVKVSGATGAARHT